MLLLATAVILVFWPVCRHDFVNYDDEINVYANGLLTDPSTANLGVVWQKPYLNLYIPLTYTSWLLLAKLSAFFPAGDGSILNPHIFHAANLLVHLANALLVFVILGHFLENSWATLAGALVFATHPVQVEPVAWVTGFKDVFCGFWSLLAIWQYLAYCRCSGFGINRARLHYGMALIFMLCAMLAKPGAMSVPVIIALLALLGAKRSLRQTALEVAPLVILALPFVIVTKMAQPGVRMRVSPDFWQRLLICGDTFSFYLKQVLLPMTIGPYYGRTPEFVLAHDWRYFTGFFPYVLLTWLLWKGARPYLLAAGIFVVSILPVSGLVPFIFQASSTVADRYLYMPMVGVALAVGLLVAAWPKRSMRLIGFALIALYGLRSMPLVHYWRDSIAFNEYGLRGNPNSRVGHSNLGKALLDSNRLDEAYQHFAESVRILPTEIAYNNMGAIRDIEGKAEEATVLYLQSIQVNPYFFMTYGNLVEMLDRTGTMANGERMFAEVFPDSGKTAARGHLNFGTALLNHNLFAEAIPHLEKAISLGIHSEAAHSFLADALCGMERWDEALSHYQAALALNPNFAPAHNGLGLLKLQQGDVEGAAGSFRQALLAQPGMLPAMNNLAFALSSLGRTQEAAQQFSSILALDPNSIAAHHGLGKILLEQNQLREAISHFRAVLQLEPGIEEVQKDLESALARQRSQQGGEGN